MITVEFQEVKSDHLLHSFGLFAIASSTTLCWYSVHMSPSKLHWLKRNNFVINKNILMKFCSTVMNPVLSEIQLKFFTMPTYTSV